jgi:Predicted permeases
MYSSATITQHGCRAVGYLWADKAFGMQDSAGEDYLVFSQGEAYRGIPGQANFKVANFQTYQVRLPHPVDNSADDIRSMPTQALWPVDNTDKKKAAELQWRLSIPLMVLVLTWIAVPLSRVNPRAGKYANILPAVLIFIVYANFLFASRQWISSGRLPVWIGMSWLHGLMIGLSGALYWQRRRVLA